MKKLLFSIIVVLSFNITISAQFNCGDTIYDVDGNAYPTVLIGTQCWMAKNLNVGIQVTSAQTNNGIIEKICFDDNSANCVIYGGLYQWNEVMQYTTTEGTQGICPNGWYVPTYDDYVILINYLGGESVAGGKMKEAGTSHWVSPNTATNSSGFTALPSGRWDYQNDTFWDLGYNTSFRTSTEDWSGYSYSVYLGGNSVWLEEINNPYGYSVRCICDGTTKIEDEKINEFNKILIYPNPSNGKFIIKGKNFKSIELINEIGQVVYRKSVSENNNQNFIDISNKPNGIYFVKISTNEKLIMKKLIINNAN